MKAKYIDLKMSFLVLNNGIKRDLMGLSGDFNLFINEGESFRIQFINIRELLDLLFL